MIPSFLALALLGCNADQQPDSGVFVGNPGKLGLTAARSSDYGLQGTILLDELRLGACGSNEEVASPLEGRVLALSEDEGSLQFRLDEPLQVPPGAWCRLELRLASASLSAQSKGDDGSAIVTYDLAFDALDVAVSGAELVIDDQELALELGEPEWLQALSSVPYDPDAPDAVDVAAMAPDVLEALQLAIEERSALYLVDAGDGAGANMDLPPEAANGDAPVWAGRDREPTEPTEPTDPPDTGTEPTDTGIVAPPQVDLAIELELPLQLPCRDVGAPLHLGDLSYVPYASDQGTGVIPAWDPNYDPAAPPIQLEGLAAALASDGQELHLLSVTPDGAAIDTMPPDVLQSYQTMPLPGVAERPEAGALATGPVFTWIHDGELVFTYASQPALEPLAEGVLDHDLATDAGDGLLVSWTEAVANPVGPGTGTAQITAWLAADRTVLFQGTPTGTDLSSPRVAVAGDRAVVAHLDGGTLVADTYTLDGLPDRPLLVDADATEAFDVALVADVVVVAWSGPDGVWLQLLDAVTGLPITAPTFAAEGGTEQVRLTAFDDGLLRILVASRTLEQLWLTHAASELALQR